MAAKQPLESAQLSALTEPEESESFVEHPDPEEDEKSPIPVPVLRRESTSVYPPTSGPKRHRLHPGDPHYKAFADGFAKLLQAGTSTRTQRLRELHGVWASSIPGSSTLQPTPPIKSPSTTPLP